MDFLNTLRKSGDFFSLLRDYCDVDVLPEPVPPQDEGGHLTYNIPGQTFARDGSGGEFILLEDGSVGFLSSEGACGRMADSLSEFFTLVVNCPCCWLDFAHSGLYRDMGDPRAAARRALEDFEEDAKPELLQIQKELLEKLGLSQAGDAVELLLTFYRCAYRLPRFLSAYTEDDGSSHSGSGTLFEL